MLRSVSAGEQIQTARFEALQSRVVQALDRVVNAIQVDRHATGERLFRQTDAMIEVGMLGRNGDQQAQFFPANW